LRRPRRVPRATRRGKAHLERTRSNNHCPFGQVKEAKDPDPSLDGVIRWWLPHSYDGLIASHAGDVWFSLWQYKGDEQAITPGMPVTWLLGEGRHGKYRKASEVQPAQP
jgi:hypothetical protein